MFSPDPFKTELHFIMKVFSFSRSLHSNVFVSGVEMDVLFIASIINQSKVTMTCTTMDVIMSRLKLPSNHTFLTMLESSLTFYLFYRIKCCLTKPHYQSCIIISENSKEKYFPHCDHAWHFQIYSLIVRWWKTPVVWVLFLFFLLLFFFVTVNNKKL